MSPQIWSLQLLAVRRGRRRAFGAAGVYGFWLRPCQRRQQAARRHTLTLATEVATRAAGGGGGGTLAMLGVTVTTENLQESFLILGELGRGAMGAVFEAAPADAARRDGAERWAVKMLLRSDWENASFRERFMREVKVCSD